MSVTVEETFAGAVARGWEVRRGAENVTAPWRRVWIARRPEVHSSYPRILYDTDADRLMQRIAGQQHTKESNIMKKPDNEGHLVEDHPVRSSSSAPKGQRYEKFGGDRTVRFHPAEAEKRPDPFRHLGKGK